MRTTGLLVSAMFASLLVSPLARSQTAAEPITIAYDAPAGSCPDGAALFREVALRTARARLAGPGEEARVLRITVTKRGESFTGHLLIEEATSRSSPREVRGSTCAEVVEALGLIAALAVDPRASTAPRASIAAPEEASAFPAASTPTTPLPAQPPKRSDSRRDLPPVENDVRRTPRESRSRFAVGAQVEGAAVAAMVGSGRVFGEVELGARERILTSSVRLALARSLDVDRAALVGRATLHWTQASLEGCPLRLPIATALAIHPCAGFSGGVIDAEGTGVGAARSRSRPWASAFAYGRGVWEPAPLLALELEAGLMTPFYRETFFFQPSVPVYEAPVLAFFGRAGVGLHFP